jgi:hypothetical protein
VWGTPKTPCVYAAPVEKEEAFHRIVDASQTIRNYLRISERIRRSMMRRALSVMEDILSNYYECALSDIIHKLNVPGHMFIWTFFLVVVCANLAQNLSAPFSYTCMFT